jgi:hypothetical protein
MIHIVDRTLPVFSFTQSFLTNNAMTASFTIHYPLIMWQVLCDLLLYPCHLQWVEVLNLLFTHTNNSANGSFDNVKIPSLAAMYSLLMKQDSQRMTY